MKKSLLSLCLLVAVGIFAQTPGGVIPVEWPVLAQVRYKAYQTPGMAGGEKPTPGVAVQRLQHQEISIQGYVIPLDIDGNTFMLSALPNASCFFCGKAGMESVVELWLQDGHRRFKMDEVVAFSGTLLINDDPYGLMYILKEAKEME